MLLKISPAIRPRLSPFIWISRNITASRRDKYSVLLKKTFSHFHLALPRMRKAGECCCRLTEAYYQEMLKANPENSLLLKNYAKYLHEVKGNINKAEEFYGKAILAQLIWEFHKDGDKAQTYFDQAIKVSPHDCNAELAMVDVGSYVIASYANFLWNWEESDGDV